VAGFRRYATYRQAMVAASVTNTVSIRTGDVATVEAFPTLKPSAVVLEFEEVTTTPAAPRGCPAPAG
jgi:hypothetical protein